MSLNAQKFGGEWSLIKLDMVERYINFFTTALKKQKFKKIYIDAFAGSGAFIYERPVKNLSLFESDLPDEPVRAGSALRALKADPPFDQIYFIESNEENATSLKSLISESRHPCAKVRCGDANEILSKMCDARYWKDKRGVVFLDPFGMNVEWATLEKIAHTKALDVWFLFSLAGTNRNLPHSGESLDAGKINAVTRILGTGEWIKEFYDPPTTDQIHLFGEAGIQKLGRRRVSVDEIETYVGKRLLTIFPHVEPPKRLKGPGNKSLFSLFFAISNPNDSAIKLAKNAASHILKRPS